MRLGKYPCSIGENTKMKSAYKQASVEERHRHRYEVNNNYREDLERSGMIVSGESPDKVLVEAVEISEHPWFVGVQFHPEFKSRPDRAHPLFREFIRAAKKNQKEKN